MSSKFKDVNAEIHKGDVISIDGAHSDVRNTPNVISHAIAENASESIDYTEFDGDGFTNLVIVKSNNGEA